MANPGHLKWLREGVASWNARIHADRFEANLSNANLLGLDLRQVEFLRVNLRNSNLQNVRLQGANLVYANLRGAILRGADLSEADVRGADLLGSDVTSLSIFSTEDRIPTQVKRTNLRTTFNLTQQHIDGMDGDSRTILPKGIKRPAHWKKVSSSTGSELHDFYNFEKNHKPDTQILSIKSLQSRRQSILLFSASLLEQIAAFKKDVRENNSLAVNKPEMRNNTLIFLSDLSEQLEILPIVIPPEDQDATDKDVEKAKTWTNRFLSKSIPGFKKYLSPEALGDVSAPASIILGCGGLGALFTLGNPIGFGIGSVAGKWITGEMKSSAAAKEIEKLASEETPDA